MAELKTNSIKTQDILNQAKQHAEKISSLVIVTDEDYKHLKKEKTQANSYIKTIKQAITDNRKQALALVDEENQVYKDILGEIENMYASFFDKMDEEQKEREKEKRVAWEDRVKRILEDQALELDLSEVSDATYKATVNLKTDKKLTQLLKDENESKLRLKADIENIKNKASEYELSSAKYVSMIEDGQAPTDVLLQIEADAEQLKAEDKARIEAKKEADEKRTFELEAQREANRQKQVELEEKEANLEERQSVMERDQHAEMIEQRMLEVQGKTKLTMTVVYDKNESNSNILNKALALMKTVADVKLEK